MKLTESGISHTSRIVSKGVPPLDTEMDAPRNGIVIETMSPQSRTGIVHGKPNKCHQQQVSQDLATRAFNRSLIMGALVIGMLFLLLVGSIARAALPPGGTFTDDNGNVHEGNIEAIAAAGITKGCNPPANDLYCPNSSVTRGQMAAFLTRALGLVDRRDDPFIDDDDSIFEADIERLAAAGITKGCNPPANDRFCPDAKVTREVMAAFLVRAFGYTDTGSGNLFIDDDKSMFEGDIDRLGTAGVTKGCNPPTNTLYCPKSLVLRDQMASFIARALELSPIIPPTRTTGVVAVAETVPVRHGGDAADDVAIWVDSVDPLNSVIIGTDKRGGLGVYGLDGRELHYYDVGRMNNVDLRQGFVLGGESVAIVAASDIDRDAIRLYSVDPVTRGLIPIGPAPIETSLGLAGLCMYHSGVSGAFSVFVTDSSGTVEQWQLVVAGGDVSGLRVRTITLASTVEGCVADDAYGYVYFAEEDRGIWRYPAEPGASDAGVLIDEVIDWGGSYLADDVEGLTIFDAGGGSGYLIASSQGSDSFVVYDRRVPNGYVGTFGIGAGSVDGVTHTDGIDVTSADLGGSFSSGLFVAQDDDNGSENQNFKLVSWSSIAALLGLAPSVPPDTVAGLYVSSTKGDDANSGMSPGEPWKSLGKAARAVQSGQTIYLERGSRWSETFELDVEATDSDRVRVAPYGFGADPIVENQSTCIRVTGSYITVAGLLVRNCSWSGITISGDNNVVEGNLIAGNAAGIYVKSTANHNTIRRNTLVDNNVMSVLTKGGSDDSGAFGILVHGDNTDIGYNTISGSNAFSYDYGWDGAAIEVYGGRNNYIHHNYAADNDTFVELGESRSRGNTVAYNVVTSNLDTSVFLVTRGDESSRGPVTGTIVDNNSVYFSGASSQGFICHGGCTPDILTLRNNIIEAQSKVGYADGSFDGDHNVFFGGQQQFDIGPHSIVADPLWRNPDAGDLRLQADSPAIDFGTTLGYTTDIDGTTVPIDGNSNGDATPDAGAHEYPV